jgi:4'-phosphopantetheinyl transferase
VAQPAQLWCCSVAELLRLAPEGGLHWLSREESLRLAGITTPRRRAQFVAGRWLGRLALAERHGGMPQDWCLSAPADAAPLVSRGPVASPSAIGLSHSGDTVACVLADRALGIDVERHDRLARDVAGLAELTLSAAEHARWQELPAAQRLVGFLGWWTLKEAWFKAHGRALDPAGLREIEALPNGAATANARLWREVDFTLALVGLDAAAPLSIGSPAPCSMAQPWQIRQAGLPPSVAA